MARKARIRREMLKNIFYFIPGQRREQCDVRLLKNPNKVSELYDWHFSVFSVTSVSNDWPPANFFDTEVTEGTDKEEDVKKHLLLHNMSK